MLAEVPAGLPADKSPDTSRRLPLFGQPDEGVQAMLKEQLKKDPELVLRGTAL